VRVLKLKSVAVDLLRIFSSGGNIYAIGLGLYCSAEVVLWKPDLLRCLNHVTL